MLAAAALGRPSQELRMRIAPTVVPLLLLVGCTIETRQAPPPAAPAPAPPPAAAPAAPAPAPAPVATAAPATPPAPATTVVGAPTTASYDPLPPQPPVTEPPAAPSQAIPVPNNNTVGVPPGLHPNAPPAYWIWRDPNNGWWHVRTTSNKGSVHRFWGSVSPQGATMAEVKGSRLEFNDRIKMTPKRAFWTFDTAGHNDGFDFRTTGAGQCVRFNVQGSGNTNVYIGGKQFSPATKHFELCP
jgi:hypothetical protein